MSACFPNLPTEIHLCILQYFSAARDLRALALTCRRLRTIVEREGWRLFVQARFATSLHIPPALSECYRWPELARGLAWQSRCWDRRSFRAEALCGETSRPTENRMGRRRGVANGPIPRALDAWLDPQTGNELVVCGAADKIEVRLRWRPLGQFRGSGSGGGGGDGGGGYRNAPCAQDGGGPSLIRLGGERYNDISDMAIVATAGARDSLAVVVGRMHGELTMLSIAPTSFGSRLAQFSPVSASNGGDNEGGVRQDTINSLSVLQRNSSQEKSLVAATTHDSVLLYPLLSELADTPELETTVVPPSVVCDLGSSAPFRSQTSMRLRRAVWMDRGGQSDGHLLALAMQGVSNPLRYLAVTPDGGWTLHSAAKNADVEARFGITYETISPKSLLSVGAWRGTAADMLLSAWHDGTCRLQDLRTPSPFDLVFQDNVDPSVMGSLVSYGTERFVAGTLGVDRIIIFDYRWTKGYYHTDGLPCGGRAPFPSAPQLSLHQQPPDPHRHSHGTRRTCDPLRGRRCIWHALSRHDDYRPNANMLMRISPRSVERDHWMRDRYPGIRSMAKACDASPSLFVGTESDIMELSLRDDAYDDNNNTPAHAAYGLSRQHPDFTSTDSNDDIGSDNCPVNLLLMENGNGIADRLHDRSIKFPAARFQNLDELLPGNNTSGRSRLGKRFLRADEMEASSSSY